MSAVKNLYESVANKTWDDQTPRMKPVKIDSIFIGKKVSPPIHVFPKLLKDTIYAWQSAFELPLDYFMSGVLASVSTAMGMAYRLKLKNEFLVGGSLYIAMVGKSGQGKTPALSCTLRPLKKLDLECLKTYKSERKAYDQESGEEVPIRKHIILNNVTMESVFKVLKENPKGIMVYQDELAGWVKSMNAYRKGSDEEHWLSIHSNDFTKVSRISTEEATLEHPFVTVVGGMQQQLLKELVKGSRKENGFLFRILFAYPGATERRPLNDIEVAESITTSYESFIHQIYTDANTAFDLDNTTLSLSAEAREVFQAYNEEICEKINEAKFDGLDSLLTKIENYCLRFALLLEIMHLTTEKQSAYLEKRTIRKEAMEGAIELAKYFEYCAGKVFSSLFENDPLIDLDPKAQELYLALPNPCTTAECVAFADKMDVYKERAAKMFLKNEDLFKKQKRGVYIKLHG